MTGIQKALNSAMQNRGQPIPTAISLVVDRSGSMGGYQSQVINSVTRLIKDQQDLRGSAIFTLAQFDHEYDVVFKEKEIKLIDASKFDYQPRGGTALLDAIVQSINDMDTYMKGATSKDQPKPKKVVIALIT